MQIFPYEQYRNEEMWTVIKAALRALQENRDLTITAAEDYVIGYLTMKVVDAVNSESPDIPGSDSAIS